MARKFSGIFGRGFGEKNRGDFTVGGLRQGGGVREAALTVAGKIETGAGHLGKVASVGDVAKDLGVAVETSKLGNNLGDSGEVGVEEVTAKGVQGGDDDGECVVVVHESTVPENGGGVNKKE